MTFRKEDAPINQLLGNNLVNRSRWNARTLYGSAKVCNYALKDHMESIVIISRLCLAMTRLKFALTTKTRVFRVHIKETSQGCTMCTLTAIWVL